MHSRPANGSTWTVSDPTTESPRFDQPTQTFRTLPHNLFRYIFEVSWLHQLLLSALTAAGFLLEVVPLELQRRAVNDSTPGL